MTESRLEELKRRVERDPATVSFAALAEEYRRLGRFAEAIETCRAGLQRHPSYTSARVTLGRALIELGDLDTAAAELEQVLRVAPENLAAIRASPISTDAAAISLNQSPTRSSRTRRCRSRPSACLFHP